MTPTRPPRWPVVAGVLVGVALGAVGVLSLFRQAQDTHPAVAVKWLVGLALAHDLLLVPLVLAIGVVVRRAPGAIRPWIAGGLVVSGAVSLIAWPLVRGYGRSSGNPSILPRDYAAGLAAVLVVVWAATVMLALLHRRRAHTLPEGPTS